MCIAEQAGLGAGGRMCGDGRAHAAVRLLCALLLLIVAVGTQAHPVTQGALLLDVQHDRIELQARVSTEEAIIANAFAAPAAQATTTDGMLAAHGRYLAARLRVYLGDARLPLQLLASPQALPADDALLAYRFALSLPAGGSRAGAVLRIEQDLLNEFEFAPGNPWEASFLVQLTQDGRALGAGRLLTRREPVQFVLPAQHVRPAARDAVAVRAPPGDTGVDGALFAAFLRAGAMHILTGYDHLLFVAALVLATVTLWDLVKVVTAFTLAHSLTLTLSVLDLVRVPERIVEPVIAASIVAVAGWNLLRPQHSGGGARLLVAFGFGLFHGLGFAGGLLAAMQGMAGAGVALAIVAFSIGVELGHQVVVLPAFATMRLLAGPGAVPSTLQRAVLRYASLLILAAGLGYLAQALGWLGGGAV